jgi:thymidylate synthase
MPLPARAPVPEGTGSPAAAADADELVKLDFERIYAVYLDNLQQKATLFKLLISFVITPYLVAVAFLSTKALPFSAIDDLSNLPTFLDFVIVVAGAGLLLPLFQYIEYDDNVMRTARSINHFRSLYVQRLAGTSTWRPNLPTSRGYPRERQLTASGSILVLVFLGISVVYLVKGLAGLAGVDPLHPGAVAVGVLAYAAFVAWYLRTGRSPLYEVVADREDTPNTIVAPSVGEAWESYLEHVVERGTEVEDDKGHIFEAPAVAITVDGIVDDDPIVREYGDANIRELYVRKMFSEKVVTELGTTYGDRLFNYAGHDQIAVAIRKLRAHSWTKSATLTLLDPLERWPERRMPCLVAIDLKVRDGRLTLYAFFRSQNALNAYGNMYGLSAIQTHCAEELGVEIGALTLFVASPHVYDRDRVHATRIVNACKEARAG